MLNHYEIEKKILDYWKKNKTFDKLRKKNKGKKRFSFLDGPITANNPMGVHHAWGRTYKDLFQRFKAMQGYDQRYQNGFDCQGLWIEREEEKDLGLKSKEDIEKFGVLNFVKACKKRVERFSKIQTEQSIKLGMWMDWDNSYYTMSDANNLHNWFLLKKYFEKKWLYKGKDAVPWCWRCGTASSKHDIVTEGYREVTHKALFMKFKIKGRENEYFLIFTTTAWTVPADTAIAVNPNLSYVKVKQGNEFYWIVDSRVDELKDEYIIVEKKNGKQLKNIEYEMPYSDIEAQNKVTSYRVLIWDMATGEEGTGIVHIAPGCGAEDFDLGKKHNLTAISPLDDAGVYKKGFGKFSYKKYSEVNKEVLEDLEERGFVYKIESYRHRYPHCWRCGEELVFRLVDEWYIKCNEIRNVLIKENKKVKWFPVYGKIRQEDWFENMSDWLISRKRFYGLPLPIWECECGNIEVIGGLKELRERAVDKKKVDNLKEVHRPWIDEIKIKCKCGKEVERIKDVGDAWLDAGIVPFSTIGPYLENKNEWSRWFPADFICENMPGQCRGWFNALFWASAAIANKVPFKSVLGYETLKDEKGEEMHKSKGNAIWFDDAVEKIGADPMRLLYCLQDPSQELRFGFNVVKEPINNINILYNISKLIENSRAIRRIENIEDRWIISRFNSLIKRVTDELEELHSHLAARALQDFWLDDLSRGYIQFVRDRLNSDELNVKYVLKEVYLGLVKLCAPFIPFITDEVWQELREKFKLKEESVHLCDWPKYDKKKIDLKLEKDMENVKEVIREILAQRDKIGLGVRWPLRKADVYVVNKNVKKFSELIKNQVNVKSLNIKEGNFKIILDTSLDEELEREGYMREVVRRIQELRKKTGLNAKDYINLRVNSEYDLSKFSEEIKKRVNAKKLEFNVKGYENMVKIKVKEKELEISFKKV